MALLSFKLPIVLCQAGAFIFGPDGVSFALEQTFRHGRSSLYQKKIETPLEVRLWSCNWMVSVRTYVYEPSKRLNSGCDCSIVD